MLPINVWAEPSFRAVSLMKTDAKLLFWYAVFVWTTTQPSIVSGGAVQLTRHSERYAGHPPDVIAFWLSTVVWRIYVCRALKRPFTICWTASCGLLAFSPAGSLRLIVTASMHRAGPPPGVFGHALLAPAGAITAVPDSEAGKLVQPCGGSREIPGSDRREALSVWLVAVPERVSDKIP